MTSSFPQGSLTRSPSSGRTLFNTAMTVLAFICGALALIPLLAVLYYVIISGKTYPSSNFLGTKFS